jgi:hypothetical protein
VITENEELGQKVRELSAQACVELFNAYDVELERTAGDFPQNDERMLCGVIGFVGSGVRGTCLLAGNEPPLNRSCPEGGRIRDWVGELANQLAGRLKAKFLARSVEVALTTPVVLSGVRLQPLPRGDYEPILLRSPDGQIMVWVEVESEPTFKLKDSEQGIGRGEGDVVLF